MLSSIDTRQSTKYITRSKLTSTALREFYLRYPIVQSLIAQFGINLPSPPSVPFTSLDWHDDAYFACLFQELPWTHFIALVRMDDSLKRAFYEVETLRNRWSVRELNARLIACYTSA